MSAKHLIRLEAARQDERQAVIHYAREAELDVAHGFRQALRDAYGAIGAYPGAGSPRYADLLGIEGLRSRSLVRFPFLIFYVEQADRIDVWRVLHARRDIPANLLGDAS